MTAEVLPMTLAAANPRPPEFDPAPDRIDPTNATRVVARTTFRRPSALLFAALLFAALLVQLLPASHGQPTAGRAAPAAPAAPAPPVAGTQLPAWLREWDADGDGQVSFFEWRMSGTKLEAFGDWDLNGDGFITPAEVARRADADSRVRWVGPEAVVHGVVEPRPDKYREKVSYRVLTVDLEAGREYRFELVGAAFQAFLFAEDAAGEPLAEAAAGVGTPCKLKYRAERTGRHRVVVTSVGGFRTGTFSLTIRAEDRRAGMPAELRAMDADRDGQVSLFEWRSGGQPVEAFLALDRNNNGYVSPEEFAWVPADRGPDLRFERGRAATTGELTAADEQYRGKVSYRVLTTDLEAGREYRLELVSAAFQAFLFLEDAAGEPLAEGSSRSVGAPCMLTYRAERTGRHRVVVTSAAGYRTGPFDLTARVENPTGPVPPWYEQLDADRDGQVSLYEWRTGGKAIPEFLALDRNNDGYVTPAELAWVPVTRDPDLKFVAGRLVKAGTVAEAAGGASHRGKVSYRVLTVDLEAGKTYRLAGVSPAFQMLVFVEDAAGEPLAEGSAAGVGEGCGLTYRAERTGRHRLVVTSVGGFRTGPFDLTARVESPAGPVPPWFERADADRDGQVSLYEWRTGGGDIDLFPLLDLNGDGHLTAEEVRRVFGR